MALNYQKAFDSLNWNAIFKAIKPLILEVLIDSIRTIFNGIETCVSNAGYTSKYFQPKNGVRQGCCVSPLLFAHSGITSINSEE